MKGISIKLPEVLVKKLEQRAKKNYRSLSAEIRLILTEATKKE